MIILTASQKIAGFEVVDGEILTPWFDPEVKPAYIGEYMASIQKNSHFRRWWNGTEWSVLYFNQDPENFKQKYRATPDFGQIQPLYWRGIYKEPIT